MTLACHLLDVFWLYLAGCVGAAVGFALCAWLTISRDNQHHHDEHEEFPGC